MIAIATGTRADWGLLSPLAHELQHTGHEVGVMVCNMHLDPRCGNTLDEIRRDGFEPVALIPTPGSAAQATAAATAGFAEAFGRLKPRAVVILGDRFEMLGVATAALLSGVPIVHIAGGTVSEGAFDDSMRHAISKMATLHLTETEACRDRLLRMGEQPGSVVVTGSIGVENVMKTPLMTPGELAESLGWEPGEEYIVATLHAATLDPVLRPAEQMRNFLDGLSQVMAMPAYSRLRVLLTYPNNDTALRPLIELMEAFGQRWGARVHTVPSLGRVRYLSALRGALAVAGNSSSGIVEVPSAGVPTLDVGVRQAGRECGPSVVHCGSGAADVARGLLEVLSPDVQALAARRINPYHRDGTAAAMGRAITEFDFHPFPSKKFYGH